MEKNSVGIMISGITRQIFPFQPGTNNIGAKAAIVVRTPKITGMATRCVPSTAPRTPGKPACWRAKMLSPTTIASSTTIPSTRMNENSEIIFTDTSKIGIIAIAPRNEIGIPIVTHIASRNRKKRASTTKTRNSPLRALRNSRSMRPLRNSELSCQVVILMPSGARAAAFPM